MKCIQKISDSTIVRTMDELAYHLVVDEGGWRYVPKHKWKEAGRAKLGRLKEGRIGTKVESHNSGIN